MLLVLSRAESEVCGKSGLQSRWLVQCDCGSKVKVVWGFNLRKGHTTSCGCYKQTCSVTHGAASHGHETVEFNAFMNMKQRTTNPNRHNAHRYIGRGIRYCEDLSTFEGFFSIMGERPASKDSVERPDLDGHYSCGQCSECRKAGLKRNIKWGTADEQARNTSRNRLLRHPDGREMCLVDWMNVLGMSRGGLHSRLRKMSVEEALTLPKGARLS